MNLIYKTTRDRLAVQVYDSREAMGEAAARHGVEKAAEIIARKGSVNIVFAAAPSQFELYSSLLQSDLDFSRVNALHMDEYIGLAPDAPQSFGNLLREKLFSQTAFASVHYINGNAADEQGECRRYAELLEQYPPDIVFHGIGENGHLAFNDPPVADFNDKAAVKVVQMDEVCRQQQVNDGCFRELEQVPKHAITITIPWLTEKVECLVVTVPGPTKVKAVEKTLELPVSEACPATILRTHPNAALFLDRDAAAGIQ